MYSGKLFLKVLLHILIFFHLLVLSIFEIGVLKSPTLIVNLSSLPFISVNFCSVNF